MWNLENDLGTFSKKKNGIFSDMWTNSRDTYPLPLLVTSLIVTNVCVLKTLPSFDNSDRQSMNLTISWTQNCFPLVWDNISCSEHFCKQILSKSNFKWKNFIWMGLKLKKLQLKTVDIDVLECWQILIYPHPPNYLVIISIFLKMEI